MLILKKSKVDTDSNYLQYKDFVESSQDDETMCQSGQGWRDQFNS